MTYLHKIFCAGYTICKNGDTCPRACTKAVKDAAAAVNTRVTTYTSHPDCFKPKKETK